MTVRLVLLCGVHEPKRKPMTATERTKRWQKKNPDKVKASRERFKAQHPNYARDYWRKRQEAMTTKAERAWMDAISQLPCCVCGSGPVHVHHILSGGRRIGHLSTIPLCFNCHASGRNDEQVVSRHPWKREFEKRYGTEQQLLERVRARAKVAA